jgi:origin recognition complex subunit 5
MEEALHDLLAHEASPSFVYLHHPHHPTSSVPLDAGTECRIAQIDAIEYHTPRLFYSGVLYRLGSDAGEVATWDEFTIALRSLNTDTQPGPSKSRKGKAAVRSNGHTNGISTSNGNHGTDGRRDRAIIIVTHAERLRTVIGGNWAVLTRLAEMVSRPLVPTPAHY